jgi:hypothetical protein
MEERDGLRDIKSEECNWRKIFFKYLEDIGLPRQVNRDNRNEVLDWLVSYAIRLEYSDNGENLISSSHILTRFIFYKAKLST